MKEQRQRQVGPWMFLNSGVISTMNGLFVERIAASLSERSGRVTCNPEATSTVAAGMIISDRPPGGRRRLPTSGSHRT